MMKKMEVGKKLLALSLGWFSMALSAQNPIVQTHYTADPAPMVYRDTLLDRPRCGASYECFRLVGGRCQCGTVH